MDKIEVNSLPVLFTRGTHYQVGYNVVSLNCWYTFVQILLNFYAKPIRETIQKNLIEFKGKAFGLLIKDFLNDLDFYNQISLPLFDLPEGRKVYDATLNICNSQFPQYVEEIQGMADGAALPFYQVFNIFSRKLCCKLKFNSNLTVHWYAIQFSYLFSMWNIWWWPMSRHLLLPKVTMDVQTLCATIKMKYYTICTFVFVHSWGLYIHF